MLTVLRISIDDLSGTCAEATGNPAILAGANQLLGSDHADIGCTIVFPTMTTATVVAVQLMLGHESGFRSPWLAEPSPAYCFREHLHPFR